MRLFAFILSIVVLVLSLVPCADAADLCTGTAQITVSHQEYPGHHHCSDTCSPFCTCSCCAGFTVTNHKVTIPLQVATFVEKVYNTSIQSQLTDISLPVWQPPQLV